MFGFPDEQSSEEDVAVRGSKKAVKKQQAATKQSGKVSKAVALADSSDSSDDEKTERPETKLGWGKKRGAFYNADMSVCGSAVCECPAVSCIKRRILSADSST